MRRARLPHGVVLVALSALALVGCGSDSGGPGGATPDTEDQGPGPADVPSTNADADPEVADDAGPELPPAPAHPSLAYAADADGPYGAGYRRFDVTYQPTGVPGPRTVRLSLWYPTTDTEGTPAVYMDIPIFDDPDVFVDASLAPPDDGERYPVHVHSHGNLGYAGATPYLMRRFATHGWVVAAPDHTGNTVVDNMAPRPTAIFFLRGQDITAVLDALEALPPDDPLAGKLAVDRVVMSGHSFGGYTAFSSSGATFDIESIEAGCATGEGPGDDGACTADEIEAFRAGVRDERVVATIPMAAGNKELFNEAGYGTVAVPILQMTGDDDDQVTNAAQSDPIWSWLTRPDAIRLDIAGGCHQTFGIGFCNLISDEVGEKIVNTFALAFARYHLFGDASVSGILDGSVQVDPAAVLSFKR